MVFCGNCGTPVDDGKFCPNCGAPVEGVTKAVEMQEYRKRRLPGKHPRH